MLEQGGFVLDFQLVSLLLAFVGLLRRGAHHGLDDIHQQPVDGLVVVKGQEELDKDGQARTSEKLAYEAQLTKIDHEPTSFL